MFNISGFIKIYLNGVKVLNGINLLIFKGMFGLFGLNGVGKLLLMRIIVIL